MDKKDEFEKIIDSEIGYIEFIQATYLDEDKTEKQHWYYVSIAPSKYEAFKSAQENGSYDIKDFGEILYHGPGTEPPEDIKELMREAYGIQDDFENHLSQAVKQINRMRTPKQF